MRNIGDLQVLMMGLLQFSGNKWVLTTRKRNLKLVGTLL